MAKRSLPPTSKNASRLSKRAKVTNLKGFFSVKSAQKPDQATKSVSPSSKNTSVVHVPESSTISTHLPELVEFVPCNDEPIEVSDVEVVSIDTPLNRESIDGDSDIFPISPVSTGSSSVDSSSYDTETLKHRASSARCVNHPTKKDKIPEHLFPTEMVSRIFLVDLRHNHPASFMPHLCKCCCNENDEFSN